MSDRSVTIGETPSLLEWAENHHATAGTLPPPAVAPVDAPSDTRRAAFDGSRKWAAGLRSMCWRKLAAMGEATADQVAEALGKSPFGVRPRFTELSQAGEIHDTGKRLRARNGKGRPQVVWSVSES